jgi:cytoskeletal protein CcmA (bactofilin family)
MLVIATPPVYGAELRQGDAIVVPAGETIEDDLYAFGQSVTIYGTVNGDVIAAGQSVTIAGTVTGDLMAAGGNVAVVGPVNGSARVAGQTVEIGAPIGHDLLAGAATLSVSPRAPIGQDVLVGGNAIALSGPVARSIRAGAETLTIGGTVGGDVMAQAGTLRLVRGAGVEGSLSYSSGSEAIVESGAAVRGMITRLEAPAAPATPSPAARIGEGVLAWFRTLVGLAAFGLVLVLLFPNYMQRSTDALAQAPGASLGFGFTVLLVMPVVALLLFLVGLLLGGWWLGPLMLALYLCTLPVGSAVVGVFIGHLVMRRVRRPDASGGWSLLAGLVVLGVVSLVPIAGGIAILAALLFGLGAGTMALKATYEQPAAGAAAPPPPEAPIERYGEPIPAR